MSHTLLVCLDVSDVESYARYRQHMQPLLTEHQGQFVLDVEGGSPRVPHAPFPANRVLVIRFASEVSARAFFSDPAYVSVKERWFTPAVRHTHATVLD